MAVTLRIPTQLRPLAGGKCVQMPIEHDTAPAACALDPRRNVHERLSADHRLDCGAVNAT